MSLPNKKNSRNRPRMLSARDIADYLNVSEHTIYRWCKSQKIPHFNLDSTYRFDMGEINTWLESQHCPGGSKTEESHAGAEKMPA